MTLNQLINKGTNVSRQLTSGSIPLYWDGKEVDIDLSLEKDERGYYCSMTVKEIETL